MLGSVADAEDVMQEAFIRWMGVDRSEVREPEAFLRRAVTRLCLDQLKSARRQRETYVGTWLPEPIVEEEPDEDITLPLMLALERLSPLERAAFFKSYSEKSFKNIIQGASGAFGNTATRLQAFVVKGGTYVYGNYPDLDALFDQQAAELDLKKRAALLEKLQQMVHERTIYAHIWQLAFINAAGPRVGESGLGLIAGHAYSAPYEDVTLAGK